MTSRQHLKSTLKHGSIYGFGVILSRLIGFIMLPIYTRVLTPEDYGVLEILSLTTDVLGFLAGLGMGAAVMRYYYYYDTARERALVISSAVTFLVVLFAASTALAMPAAGPLAHLVLGEPEYSGLVRLALIAFLLSSLIEIPLVYLRAKQLSTQVVLFNLLRLLLALSLNILLVVVLRWGVRGVLISTITASSITGGILFWRTIRETGLGISWPIMRQLARYGVPLIVLDLGSFVLHNADRYFLRAYGSLAEVGLYSLGYKFAMLLSLLIAGPFFQIWMANALEIHKSEGERAVPLLQDILSYYNLLLVGGALGIALFGAELVRIVADPSFAAAARPIPLLCVGMVLFNYRFISQLGAMIRERSGLIGASAGIAAATVLGLNFLLIPRWGMMGAAWATVGAFAVEYVIMSAMSRRVWTEVFPATQLLRPWVAALAVWGAVELAFPADAALAVAISVKLAAMVAFGVLLLPVGALSRDQRELLSRGLRDPRWALGNLRGGN
jgi:O-antigen/teichoic acid export membrane protein